MSDSEKEASEKVSVPNGWKPDEFKPEDNPTGVLEESKFLTLFPKYREKYLKEIWPLVEKFLEPYKIKGWISEDNFDRTDDDFFQLNWIWLKVQWL